MLDKRDHRYRLLHWSEPMVRRVSSNIAIDQILALADEPTVVVAMYPSMPRVLIQSLVESARERGQRIRLLVADYEPHFAYLGDGSMADVTTIAGRVPHRFQLETAFDSKPLWTADAHLRRAAGVDAFVVSVGHRTGDTFPWGPSVAYSPAAVESARLVVAATHDSVQSVHGSVGMPVAQTDLAVRMPDSFPTFVRGGVPNSSQLAVADLVARIVPHGATIQVGIGKLGDAISRALGGHKRLSVHSGVISGGLIDLKRSAAGSGDLPTVGTTLLGGSDLYRSAHEMGTRLALCPISHTHSPTTLRSLPRFFALNSALAIDLIGEVNAAYIGKRRVSTAAGLLDFVPAGHEAPDGASVVAMTARTSDGRSRVVPRIPVGQRAGVAGKVDFVVTEYGIADLRGVESTERVRRVLAVAHPEDRSELARQWKASS